MRPVVVAHGLWMPGTESVLLRRRLAAAGFVPYLFRFPTVSAGLDENAARLARFIEAVPGERIDIVGHSLGGVVAVSLLEHAPPPRAGAVVCLGSPLKGSLAGRALARWPAGRRVLGRSLADLERRGGLAPWRGECPLGIVAGSLALGMGRVICELPSPNDGTVSVEETRLEGAADHIVLPVSHFTMLASRRVAAQVVAFLRTGRFEHG